MKKNIFFTYSILFFPVALYVCLIGCYFVKQPTMFLIISLLSFFLSSGLLISYFEMEDIQGHLLIISLIIRVILSPVSLIPYFFSLCKAYNIPLPLDLNDILIGSSFSVNIIFIYFSVCKLIVCLIGIIGIIKLYDDCEIGRTECAIFCFGNLVSGVNVVIDIYALVLHQNFLNYKLHKVQFVSLEQNPIVLADPEVQEDTIVNN